MAEKDMTEKSLEGYNDVFADIMNVLLFNGKRKIQEQDLEDVLPRSFYKADGRLREQERDVAKLWKNGVLRLALCGFENQTDTDADMPLRVIAYDGASYRSQLIKKKKETRYPVITLVLYFGYEKHWGSPQKLKDRLVVPEELDPFVNDYKMNLFEIAYLSQEQIGMFRSDFRIVADYFSQMRENRNYVPSKETITHVQELLHLLAVLTQDHHFEEVYQEEDREGEKTMCEYVDRLIHQGMEQGMEQERIRVNQLNQLLLQRNRLDDLKRTITDPEYQEQLMKELLPKDTVRLV